MARISAGDLSDAARALVEKQAGVKVKPTPAKRRGRSNAQPVTIDNEKFASGVEGARYVELRTMQQAGLIRDLRPHPSWQLVVNNQLIGRYTADFEYYDIARRRVVHEDVKSKDKKQDSRDFVLRKKLVKALYGVEIVVVRR